MKKGIKTLAMWLIIGVITIVLLSSIMENSSSKITYSELITSIENSDVESITISSGGTTASVSMRLSDDELDQVAGGFNPDADEETCPYHRGCYKYNSEFCNKETCIWAK